MVTLAWKTSAFHELSEIEHAEKDHHRNKKPQNESQLPKRNIQHSSLGSTE